MLMLNNSLLIAQGTIPPLPIPNPMAISTHLPPHLPLSPVLITVKVVKRLKLRALAEENPALEPVGHGLGELILDEGGHWHGEDVVELLERALLCLRQEEEDEDEAEHVEPCVQTEDALSRRMSVASWWAGCTQIWSGIGENLRVRREKRESWAS
jgi:hypothetical protein